MKRKSYKNRIWKRYLAGTKGEQQGLFGEEDSSARSVRLFSRNLEDLTDMFPEIVAEAKSMDIGSVIFDSEVVGFNENTEEFATFQSTMKRRRKYNIKKASEDQPIKAFVFDILYQDGKDLMDLSNDKRVKIVEKLLSKEGVIRSTESVVIDNVKELESKFHEKINAGLEGIIAKKKDTKYQPGNRGFDWIKIQEGNKG